MGNIFKALIRPDRMRSDNVQEVRLDLFNPDGSPAVFDGGGEGGGGGGGGVSSYIDGHLGSRGIMGTIDYLYFDGSDPDIEIVGFDLGEGQSLELPTGVYTSSWQWGFDTTADAGPGDTTRAISVQIQPLGRALEDYPQKPEGGWADFNPYQRVLGYDFIVPTEGNDLIVQFDASTSDETNVNFWLNFTLIKLGDIPEG